ncbi:hypothetical protein BM1_05272 [Bipolaris maydis]|nr:hypothetical protein BM1_05272 [Bipolaris maydis]
MSPSTLCEDTESSSWQDVVYWYRRRGMDIGSGKKECAVRLLRESTCRLEAKNTRDDNKRDMTYDLRQGQCGQTIPSGQWSVSILVSNAQNRE